MKASSNLKNSSSLSPSVTSNTIITDSINSNLTNNNTSRYKNYLIEKLLNESIAPLQNSLKPANDILSETNTNNCSNIKIMNGGNGLNDSREDLTSETGTYVIDEPVSAIRQCHTNNSNNLKQSTNTIDLISARAAIDETFGVVISGSMEDPAINLTNEPTTPQLTPKRQTQKIIRARNQTYSLTKDLFMNNDTENNLSTNSPSYNDDETRLLSNDSSLNSSLLRKTTTYDIIPNDNEKTEVQSSEKTTNEAVAGKEGSSEVAKDDDYENNNKSINESTVSTIKTICTDVLLGDTERLMEQLKLKRFEKRQSLKARLISANHNLNQSRSSSSSCSSSTTILSGNQNSKEFDDNNNNEHLNNNDSNGRTAKSWIIPLQTYYKEEEEETTKSLNEMYFNSTRATVNGSQDLSNSAITTKIQQIKNQSKTNGGVAFDFILDYRNNPIPLSSSNINNHNNSQTDYDNDESLASNSSNSISASNGFNHLRRLKSSADSTTMGSASTSITTPKSGLSLGAKIQNKAKENLFNTNNNSNTSDLAAKQRQSLRRSSDNSSLLITNTNNLNSNSTIQNPSQYTNRTLMLRQQTAKARRNSDNKLTSDQDLSPPNTITQSNMKPKPTLNGVLKKSGTNGSNGNSYVNGATSSMISIKSTVLSNVTSLTNKSFSNLTTSVSSPTSKSKKSSRSNSRETTNHNGNGLMTTSLTLPNGSNSLPGGSSHTDQRDSFLRRKTYDPVKAVELEKQKKKELKRKSLLLQQEQQQLKITEDFDVKSQNSNCNGTNNCLNCSIDENSVYDSFNSFPLPNTITNRQPKSKPLTNSVSFDQQNSNSNNHRSEDETSTYEKILQSTLQRLCIRLIQMSTGVLDKIGDNSSKNSEPSSLLNTSGSTELERMQQLAKLVHSMQLVHDHVQIIDSTLFNPKPEEAYMKELSRIRQELASLNASSNLINNNSQNKPQ